MIIIKIIYMVILKMMNRGYKKENFFLFIIIKFKKKEKKMKRKTVWKMINFIYFDIKEKVMKSLEKKFNNKSIFILEFKWSFKY